LPLPAPRPPRSSPRDLPMLSKTAPRRHLDGSRKTLDGSRQSPPYKRHTTAVLDGTLTGLDGTLKDSRGTTTDRTDATPARRALGVATYHGLKHNTNDSTTEQNTGANGLCLNPGRLSAVSNCERAVGSIAAGTRLLVRRRRVCTRCAPFANRLQTGRFCGACRFSTPTVSSGQTMPVMAALKARPRLFRSGDDSSNRSRTCRRSVPNGRFR